MMMMMMIMMVNGDGVGVSGGGGVFVCLADCLPFRQDQGAVWPGSQSARVLLADSLRGANWPGSEKARYRTYRLAYIIEFTMADADILFIRREATEVTSLSITPRTHGRRVVPPFAGPTLHNLL